MRVSSSGRLAVLVIAAVALPYARARAQDDHRLLTRYQGSTVIDRKYEDFGEYQLIVGRTPQGEFRGERLKGKLTRFVYRNPEGRSTLEIFTNYADALRQAGLVVTYQCAINECGPAYARSAWGRFNGLFVAADGDPRYLGGKIAAPNGTAYVAVLVGKGRTQVDILEVAAMETDMVVADAGALASGLDRDGRVSVYGIYFDTDKSDVKPESKAALDEIAKLLRQRPQLRLFVVGHTDMTGGFAHNRSLSESRAQAVVRALVEQYSIGADRLEGYGVGPLAPAATNGTDGGRAKNRRVELVAR
jgi:outer membrane protein OmpA-like peptidoglycan-associated protein